MKNDGTYYQLTKVGKYYPKIITRWKWQGIDFFISPEIIAAKPFTSLKQIRQKLGHMVVTHKGTGYTIPDINSVTLTDAKICAEWSLNKLGYDGFISTIKIIQNKMDKSS